MMLIGEAGCYMLYLKGPAAPTCSQKHLGGSKGAEAILQLCCSWKIPESNEALLSTYLITITPILRTVNLLPRAMKWWCLGCSQGKTHLYFTYQQGFVFRVMESGMRAFQERVKLGEKGRGWEMRQVWHLWTEMKSHLVLSYGSQSFYVFSEKYESSGEPEWISHRKAVILLSSVIQASLCLFPLTWRCWQQILFKTNFFKCYESI